MNIYHRINHLTDRQQKALVVTKLIGVYDELTLVGGSLHILLEDGNYDAAAFCFDSAKANEDKIGMLIADLLLGFTPDEIQIIVEENWRVELLEFDNTDPDCFSFNK